MQRSLPGECAHLGTAATLQKLGDLNLCSGDLKKGIKFLQESLKMQRSLHGDHDHPGIAATLHKLADATAQSGDVQTGMEMFQESLRMQQSLHGDCDLGMAITLYKLGDLAICTGNAMQGIEFFEHSLQMQRLLHGDRAHPSVAVTLRKLGDVMAQTGRVTDSMRLLLEALQVHRSLYGDKSHPHVADLLHSLGAANQRAGDFEQAEQFLEESLRMKESLFADKKHPSLRLTSTVLEQVRMTAHCLNRIHASALRLGELFEDESADTADANPLTQFDFHNFVFSETGAIRQLAKKILRIHGAEPAANLEAQNARTIYSKPEVTREVSVGSAEICTAIASLTDFMITGTQDGTFETACNDIIGRTFAIEDLLLDFIWATKGARKSDQDFIIQTFRNIREIALECESQLEEASLQEETSDYEAGKVLLETVSIRQLAEKIFDEYRAPPGEPLNVADGDSVSKVFRAIVAATTEVVLLGGNYDYWAEYVANYLSICRDIVHATCCIEGLLKPFPGLCTSKMAVDDDSASTASLPETLEQLGQHIDVTP